MNIPSDHTSTILFSPCYKVTSLLLILERDAVRKLHPFLFLCLDQRDVQGNSVLRLAKINGRATLRIASAGRSAEGHVRRVVHRPGSGGREL